MIFTFAPSRLCGSVRAIRSKSAAHRLLLCGALADKPTFIECESTNDDILATVRVLSALGARIEERDGGFAVTPVRTVQKGALLDCGESGSTLRFLLPVAAALGADASFVRKGRLSARPLSPLYEEMARHGAILPPDPSLEPLPVKGKLTAGEYTLAADVSSQFISGLLLAMPLMGPSALTLTGPIESEPYIRLTLSAMAAFGAAPAVSADRRRYEGGNRPFSSPGTVSVEGDWSNAALWLAAGAMGKDPVTVTGLGINSLQGDRRIMEILEAFGASVSVRDDAVTVAPAPLHGISFDASQIPDLVPVLAAVAAAARGETVITGIRRLRLKESDRASAIETNLSALGVSVQALEDRLIIEGGKPLTGGTVSSFRDHRMVMSAALCSLLATDPVSVTQGESVNKSYPGFADDLTKLGGTVHVKES